MWFWGAFSKMDSNSNQKPHGRGSRQGDTISAFLFILALEVSFVLLKSNNNIKGLDIYGHNFLYTAYADDKQLLF